MYKKLALLVGVLSFVVLIMSALMAYDWLVNRGEDPDECCHTHDTNTLVIIRSTPEDDDETPTSDTYGHVEEADEVRDPAPDFAMYDPSGNEVQLSDFFGQPIVLGFWTTTCPACVVSLPPIQQLYDDVDQDVHVVMVIMQQPLDTVEDFMANNMYNFPVYFDTRAREGAIRYGVQFIPTTFFIDADGGIAYSHVGAVYDELIERGLRAAGVE